MADIFVSYTSSDRDWAFWIARELEALGHVPRVHEWEIKGSADIYAWMQQRVEAADHMLCVTSEEYLNAAYSTHERNAALWKSARNSGFALIVVVKPCRIPTLFAQLKRYSIHGVDEQEARQRIAGMFAVSKPSSPVPFPGTAKPAGAAKPGRVPFPGASASSPQALSNIPIAVPRHFLGRDEALADIGRALSGGDGRAAITALHGLRGVGKTTLAAAYAERHRTDYRATWWIRAHTEPTMRADLVALGVRLDWVAADEKEEPALAGVLERLAQEGDGILLIYDNAPGADAVKSFLPRGGAARVILTSNAPAWRGVAAPVEIRLWPNDVGADYLIARTGRTGERDAALALSEALGGLPLALEQAAAYCERLEVPFAEYASRFAATPARFLDDARHAPAEYHDGLTVAKTFALAIDEAARLHPGAAPLIEHAALLAPEPIPLFLYSETRETFGEPLASALAGDGLDEAVAALRSFALIDRETIADERDPSIATDCIRLHRLVRQVAGARCEGEARQSIQRSLIEAVRAVYPGDAHNNPAVWPRTRRLDAIAFALVGGDATLPDGAESGASDLLNRLGSYRHTALAAYAQAKTLFERALAISESVSGPEHPDTATSLNNLAGLLDAQGDLAKAKPLYQRALAIREKVLGAAHPDTATSLNNLAYLLDAQGDLGAAKPLFERALAIRQRALGPDHPDTARSLNNLAALLDDQRDVAGAKPLYERALAIREKALGPEHPDTALSVNNLAALLYKSDDIAGAKPLFERALAIREKVLGPEHPDTAISLSNLAYLLRGQGDLAGAKPLYQRALAIREKVFGPEHPNTASSLNAVAGLLQAQGDLAGARPLYERALSICEKALGADHPTTKTIRDNLAALKKT